MNANQRALAGAILIGLAASATTPAASADPPARGGIFTFMVASEIPSYDMHRETTFGVVHPVAPFYSLLIRINPDNPSAADDFQCDVCEGAVPEATEGGTLYTFRIRKDITFHDGTPLSARDVVATFNKIIFPPQDVPSSRKAQFPMVESIAMPDDYTVSFKLKYPSGAFLPALATPFNAIYSARDIEKGYDWHTKNINGTGPFMFVQQQPGAFTEAKRYPRYHHVGEDGKPLPYLDGYKAIQAPKEAVRVQAIRGNRAAIEFRGLSPNSRDTLVAALGDKITVQESDWNCVLLVTPNHKKAPFDDPRVRRALTLSLDRWGGSEPLSKIAIVKRVGGVVFPGHPLAASTEELQQIAGYGADIEKSREQARKLLAEAGHPGLAFELSNRGVDQPYKVVGTWLVDQWSKVGMKATQQVMPTGPFYDKLRKKRDFDVSMDFNCQSLVNPLADVSKFVGSAPNNYAQFDDKPIEDLYDRMNRTADTAEQYRLMREFEKRVLDDEATQFVTLWWYRIVPHRSYVRGWKISPSHYLNQQLDTVWLDPTRM